MAAAAVVLQSDKGGVNYSSSQFCFRFHYNKLFLSNRLFVKGIYVYACKYIRVGKAREGRKNIDQPKNIVMETKVETSGGEEATKVEESNSLRTKKK